MQGVLFIKTFKSLFHTSDRSRDGDGTSFHFSWRFHQYWFTLGSLRRKLDRSKRSDGRKRNDTLLPSLIPSSIRLCRAKANGREGCWGQLSPDIRQSDYKALINVIAPFPPLEIRVTKSALPPVQTILATAFLYFVSIFMVHTRT